MRRFASSVLTKGTTLMRTHRRPGRAVALPRHTPSTPTRAALPRPSHCALAVHAALVGISLVTLGVAAMPVAMAQSATQSASTAREYSLSAGQLGDVLAQFAATSGVQLVFDPTALAGQTSPGLQGSYTVQQGFSQLLQDSGWEIQAQGGKTYTLRQVRQTLPEVTVTAPGGGSNGSKNSVATLPEVVVTAGAQGITEGTGSFTTDSTSAATGLNLSLRETPQSVSVITRQRIDDQGLASMDEIMRQTVGVSTVQVGMTNDAYIRGYQVTNYQIDGISTTHGSFGIETSMGFDAVDSAIYDSVATVRGAAGLLTGAGDPSGSVSLVRKRPMREFQASVEGGVGRWDQYRAAADVGGPLNASGSLRGRLVGAYSEGKSWVANYREDSNVVYGVLEADIMEHTLLSLALEHSENSTRGGFGTGGYALPLVYADGTLTPFDRHSSKLPTWPMWENERTSLALSLERALNDDWRVKLDYRHDDVQAWNKRLEAWGSFDQNHYFSGGFTNHNGADNKTDSFSATLNGRYALLGRQHELVAGFNGSFNKYVQKQKGGGISEWGFTGLPIIDGVGVYPEPDWNGAATVTVAHAETKQSGFYLTTRIHMTDRLSSILGGRWSSWKYDAPDWNDHRKFSNVFVPYAGIVYDLTGQISAYASYTEIFQPQSARDINGGLLDPEEGKNYEIGLKGEWFDGRLNTSIAVFETRKDNLAVYDYDLTGPTGDPVARAEDGTKGRGWELEASGELAPGWQLQGGYTRFVLRDSSDQRMRTELLPEHLFKLFTTYSPQSLPRLTMGGGVNWQSKVYRSTVQGALLDLYTQKSFAVANLMANYQFSNQLSLNVNLNNVFNKEYRTRVNLHTYGAERNLSASLKYQF